MSKEDNTKPFGWKTWCERGCPVVCYTKPTEAKCVFCGSKITKVLEFTAIGVQMDVKDITDQLELGSAPDVGT